jgi:hypothetical protein
MSHSAVWHFPAKRANIGSKELFGRGLGGFMGNSGSDESLATWLQEVARRPWPDGGPSALSTPQTSPESSEQLLDYLEMLTGRRLRSRDDIRRFVAEGAPPQSQAWQVRVRRSIRRQSLVLIMLAAAILQFYFLDVNLKIQSLNSAGAFAPAASPLKAKT